MLGARNDDVVPHVLFIDAYDSFTHNIVSLLETELGVEVTIIKIDEKIDNFAVFLKPYAAVIAGPGPGHPQNPGDVGLISRLWELRDSDVLPVLGICLGFQSLVLAYGGSVEPLPEPRHGMVRNIRTCGEKIFAGVCDISAVQYHSLYASIKHMTCQNGCFHVADSARDPGFKSTLQDLYALAWDLKEDNYSTGNGLENKNPESILMAVAHRSKPYYGVQFHPESICSDSNARRVVSVWWKIAEKWNRAHRYRYHSPRITLSGSPIESKMVSQHITGNLTISHGFSDFKNGLSTNFSTERAYREFLHERETLITPEITSNGTTNHHLQTKPSKYHCDLRVLSEVLEFLDLSVPDICEALNLISGEVVVFDSECSQRPATGIHSIIGITEPDSLKLEYSIGTHIVRQVQNGKVTEIDFRAYGETIFSYLKTFMKRCKTQDGNRDIPFWGGLMGYITYEAGLETLGIPSRPNPLDLSFIFIQRSIVFDHLKRTIHVQSIKSNDKEWISHTASVLNSLKPCDKKSSLPCVFRSELSLPDERFYKSKIGRCQEFLRSGDSYELCLTTESRVWTPQDVSPWSLYLRLRKQNSAPFSTFIRLGPLTHVSSSPERFFSWTRPSKKRSVTSNSDGINGTVTKNDRQLTSICQFRPMKGTVRRQRKDPALPQVTLEEATKILATPKERAENLMIVDLIRHDLHGVAGSGNVEVTKLMVVEEYATLYQLVTVIEGTLHINHEEDEVILSNGKTDGTFKDTTNGTTNVASNGTTNGYNTNHHNTTTSQSHQHRGFTNGTTPQANFQPPKTPSARHTNLDVTGIDVLAASLPPGSMTGAPKKRSCSILQSLEQRNRGVYSGVVGYLDVGGGGDFSVVIRSAFRWDGDWDWDNPNPAHQENKNDETQERENVGVGNNIHRDGNRREEEGRGKKSSASASTSSPWIIGAGGAVTCLSTEEGEWEEMCGKLWSTMRVFAEGGGGGGGD